MTIKTLLEKLKEFNSFEIVNEADFSREIGEIYCCDLLSIAMSKVPENGVWLTVMGNVNSIAVASLSDVSLLVIAEGVELDETVISKAQNEGINVIKTKLPIFNAALKIYQVGMENV